MDVKEQSQFEYEGLSDAQVARLIFRKLWQILDAGGLSMGRSMEAAILEVYTDFTPVPELPLDFKEPRELDLVLEAQRRIARGVQLHLPVRCPASDIRLLATEEFPIVALCELREYCLFMKSEQRWPQSMLQLAELGFQLMGLPERRPIFYLQEFLKHARWRQQDAPALF
jgi:hypothetical protein